MDQRRSTMHIMFGVLSLLAVLAIVGALAKRQLQAVRAPIIPEAGASATAMQGTPAQPSQQLQKKIADDVNQLMQQAPVRIESAVQ